MEIRIDRLSIQDASIAFEWVLRLLQELGDEGDDLGTLNEKKVLNEWKQAGDRFQVFAAKTSEGKIIGVMTLMETFAVYANGNYGIINEMYTDPESRSSGVGAALIDAAKQYGRARGWERIDVTAPESPGWERSRQFYEKNGFHFTGPKLKFVLK
ncbi:MAG TPA: GNAT family N-acetyltransferase [Acidobacteriota bacterium]|jgi:GNAT superfamily N-acetyltransferase